MEVDLTEIVKIFVDSYDPWAVLVAGGYLLYRQNIELSNRLDTVTEKFIELSQQSIEINRSHTQTIDDLQDKIILYYVKRNIQSDDTTS